VVGDADSGVEAGKVGGFAVNQTFLLGTTAYVLIPSLMLFCVLVLRPRLNRIVNIALAMVYAVSIVAATIGEWAYYLMGSLIEVALLAAVIFYAWTWPKEIGQTA
jgi:membrane protein DedA with SNARE-associated domain